MPDPQQECVNQIIVSQTFDNLYGSDDWFANNDEACSTQDLSKIDLTIKEGEPKIVGEHIILSSRNLFLPIDIFGNKRPIPSPWLGTLNEIKDTNIVLYQDLLDIGAATVALNTVYEDCSEDTDVLRVIDDISLIAQTNTDWCNLGERLSFLYEEVLDEQAILNIGIFLDSLLMFKSFLIKYISELKYPRLFLSSHGGLRAEWKASNNKLWAIEFLQCDLTRSLIFAPEKNDSSSTKRLTLYCSVSSSIESAADNGVDWIYK